LIEGIDPKITNMQNIVKELKSQFACGGSKRWVHNVTGIIEMMLKDI
jgi:translation initiation factor 1 (eIF-1/SUI1)